MARSSAGREFRVIWAVDPDTDPRLQKAAMHALKALASRRRTTIEPVYVLSGLLDSTPSRSFGEANALSEAAIGETFRKQLSRSGLKDLRPLHFLTGTVLSMRRKTLLLANYANSRDADLILLGTHGRRGIKRWFIGSFADSMMQQTDLPLFVVNPHWKRTSDLRTILFPTDFSDESKQAYLKVVEFAKHSRSPIIIFHKTNLDVTSEMYLMLQQGREYARIIGKEASDSRAHAMEWAQEGRRQGARVKVTIDAKGSSSVADAILKLQARTGGIVALASRSGDSPPFLTGTATRAVVQGSTSAVWVLYPRARSAYGRNRALKIDYAGAQKTAA